MYDYWGDVESIIIPDGVTAIEDSALPNDIINITIPESVTSINSPAINPCGEKFTIYAKVGSYVEVYAKEKDVPFIAI